MPYWLSLEASNTLYDLLRYSSCCDNTDDKPASITCKTLWTLISIIIFFFLNLKQKNYYAPVSQAHWYNVIFTAGNLLPSHSYIDMTRVKPPPVFKPGSPAWDNLPTELSFPLVSVITKNINRHTPNVLSTYTHTNMYFMHHSIVCLGEEVGIDGNFIVLFWLLSVGFILH